MSWHLKGSYAETCSCESDVSLQLLVRPRRDLRLLPCHPRFQHWQRRDRGHDVSGLKAAVIIDTPKVMTEGNWRVGMFVDESATDEQLGKLTAVLGGQLGGPMEGLVPLIGEMLGVERAAIEVVDDGLKHASGSGMQSTSRSRTSFRSAWRRASPSAWSVSSTLSLRSSTRRKRRGRGSTRSGSSTKARPASRRLSSRGPPEGRTTWLTRRRTTGSVTADRGIARGLHRDQRNRAEHHGTRLAVLKTVDGAMRPWVRIPPPPLEFG